MIVCMAGSGIQKNFATMQARMVITPEFREYILCVVLFELCILS